MTEKKIYQKPRISRVRLAPEEAVLTACKTTSGGGGIPTGGTKCSETGTCQVQGT